MFYSLTLISVFEVLLEIVPMLLAVAYITVAERKTMASMQRRLGPNAVGYNNKLRLYESKRFYHNSSINSDKEAIKELYKNRIAPVKEFDCDVILTCTNLVSLDEINLFFKELKDKGGIYMLKYKFDPNIYYIGRAKNFQNRLKSHLKTTITDRFHKFGNLVGWDKFEFSIIEICELNTQQEREDYYLQKYLPVLNTIFKSNLSETQTYESLYDILKLKQTNLDFDNKYIGITIYLYEYIDGHVNLNFKTFASINALSENIGVARETIKVYLNTNVPFKNYIFFTNKIDDCELIEKLISDATQGLNLHYNIAKKIWIYFIESDGKISKIIFESTGAAARFLKVHHTHITYHIDKWIKGGLNGYYVFSKELNNLELEKLTEFSLLRKTNNCTVWAYNAQDLELIHESFNSMQKAAEYFDVDYRSILKHLDTKLATKKGGQLVLLFSKELTKLEKTELLN